MKLKPNLIFKLTTDVLICMVRWGTQSLVIAVPKGGHLISLEAAVPIIIHNHTHILFNYTLI